MKNPVLQGSLITLILSCDDDIHPDAQSPVTVVAP